MSRRRYRQVVFKALPGTVGDVHRSTGISKVAVWRWIKSLHEAGEAHIAGWRRVDGGGPFQAVYAPGEGCDVPLSLKPFTRNENTRRFRARARKSGHWEDVKRRNRAKYWISKPAKRDPMVAALFGES